VVKHLRGSALGVPQRDELQRQVDARKPEASGRNHTLDREEPLEVDTQA
jgi:hypothetical protein